MRRFVAKIRVRWNFTRPAFVLLTVLTAVCSNRHHDLIRLNCIPFPLPAAKQEVQLCTGQADALIRDSLCHSQSRGPLTHYRLIVES